MLETEDNKRESKSKVLCKGMGLLLIGLLTAIQVRGQGRLEDYPCLLNALDKYHVVIVSEYANDTSFFHIFRFYARCSDTTCADMRSPQEIKLLLSGLENDLYDWSCNLALYEIYQRDVGILLSVKPRQWRKHYRDDDIADWRERIKEPPPPLPPPFKPLRSR